MKGGLLIAMLLAAIESCVKRNAGHRNEFLFGYNDQMSSKWLENCG
jgi:hypothetical protein